MTQKFNNLKYVSHNLNLALRQIIIKSYCYQQPKGGDPLSSDIIGLRVQASAFSGRGATFAVLGHAND